MKQRCGVSLIETVSNLSIIATVLMTSAFLMNRSFRVHRESLEHLRKISAVSQFVDRLRTDVHYCQSLKIDEGLSLSLSSSKSIRYAASGNTVVRTLELESTVAGTEEWILPAACSLDWKVDRNGPTQLLLGNLRFVESLDESNSVHLKPIGFVARLGTSRRGPSAVPEPPKSSANERGDSDSSSSAESAEQ